MSATVFANGMSIACKVASGKTTAAMPDVCLSPPSPPAGPIPIPYPNTASASDTDKGSTTVSIGGEPVMLKDRSIFKTSTGNEAATRNLGMGVVTHKITGEAQFVAWSMDVKFEGENVPRHMDLMGHNEACVPSQTPVWPYIDSSDLETATNCANDIKREHEACSSLPRTRTGRVQKAAKCASDEGAKQCRAAQKCMLQKHGSSRSNCCPGEESHHPVEVHCFSEINNRTVPLPGFQGYNLNRAPTVCASGGREDQQHGLMHAAQQQLEAAYATRGNSFPTPSWPRGESKWTYGEAREAGVAAHKLAYPDCDSDCIRSQLDAYHGQTPPNGPGVSEDTPVRTDTGASGRSVGALDPRIERAAESIETFITAPEAMLLS